VLRSREEKFYLYSCIYSVECELGWVEKFVGLIGLR